MKPFDNKTHFDPGRFRTKIGFYRITESDDEFGGTVRDHVHINTVKAISLSIRNNDQLAISAGASVVNEDRYFVIRKGFKPEYDMTAVVGDKHYTLAAIVPVDVPVKYWRLLCIRKEDQDTWQS